jgi:hypothetical protein
MKPLSTGNFTTLTITAAESEVVGLKIGTVDNRSGSTGHAISASNINDLIIEGNYIVYGATKVFNGINLVSCNSCRIRRNRFAVAPSTAGLEFTEGGADIQLTDSCSYNLITENKCVSGNVYGINITTTDVAPVCRDNLIENNYCFNSTAYGIIIYRATDFSASQFTNNKVINNSVINITGSALDTLAVNQFGAGIYLQFCHESIVDGNTVWNVCQLTSASTLPMAGICGTQNSAKITNNYIKTSGESGIYFSSGDDASDIPDLANSNILISGNTIEDVDSRGIWSANSRKVLITDNVIYDTGSTMLQVDSSASWKPRTTIANNILEFGFIGISADDCEMLDIRGNQIDRITTGYGVVVGSSVSAGHVDNNTITNSANGYQINAAITVGDNSQLPTQQWQAATAYAEADVVYNGANVYRCVTGGTSAGSGGPTGTGSGISDGTVTWDFVSVYYAGSFALYGGSFGKVRTLANAATPSVKGGHSCLHFTGGTTTITDFADGEVGEEIFIRSSHVVTITHGSGINLSGNANFNMTGGDTLTLVKMTTSTWEEKARMDR